LLEIKQAVAEAEAELKEEAVKVAKGKIKESLKRISAAESVVANLRREHEVLLKTIGAE
jgi:hypothetical protein